MSKEDENSKKIKSGMVEIKDLLKNQHNNFAMIDMALKDTSQGLDKIGHTYENYDSAIDKSKAHIKALERQEFYENMFIYIGFIIFFICVAWVMHRRFPLLKVIYLLYQVIEYIFIYLVYLKDNILANYIFKNLNSTQIPNSTLEINNITISINNIINKTEL